MALAGKADAAQEPFGGTRRGSGRCLKPDTPTVGRRRHVPRRAGIRAGRQTKDGETREYMLAGLVVCAVCGRRMDGHWVHGRAGYRCRHGYTSCTPRSGGAVRNLYLREDHLLGLVPELLVNAGFRFDRLDQLRQRDLVDVLRRERLQIVCNREGPILIGSARANGIEH